MRFHPVANIFPMMSAEEFEALKADIEANGQREPIWLHDNQIVDGRNRYNACQAPGVEPRYRHSQKATPSECPTPRQSKPAAQPAWKGSWDLAVKVLGFARTCGM